MKKVHHYTIQQQIGKGGMGEVYSAVDTRLGRRVALKMLSKELSADPIRRARFENEARAIAALNHPNIVTIHSVEEYRDSLFLIMELVEGKPLSQMIPPGGFPLERFFELANPIADAVTVAHQRNITHRDLKPSNVMVTSDGRVKVLDFGLAKITDPGAPGEPLSGLQTVTMTSQGMIVGTVDYMSPEQAQGKPVDGRSDIFSLGIMFYEMATGERPFKGGTPVATISSILGDEPPSVTALKTNLPRHLGRIVSRCLAKDPDRRYQSASDLRNDLQGLKEEVDSGEIYPPGPLTSPTLRVRRGSTWIVAMLLALVAASLLYFALDRGSRSDPMEPFQEMKITRLTTAGNTFRAAVSPDGKYVVEVVREGGKYSLRLSQTNSAGGVEIVPPTEAVLAEPIFSPEGDSIYYMGVGPDGAVPSTIFRVPLLGGTPQRILGSVLSRISFSPDGKQLAFLRLDGPSGETSLIVSDRDGSGQRVMSSRTPPAIFESNPAWAPDGRLIAVAVAMTDESQGSTGLVAIPLNGGDERLMTPRKWGSVAEIEWLPGGRGLVIAGRDGLEPSQLWEVRYPESGVRRITNDLTSYQSVSLTADGETLVTVIEEPNFHLWVWSSDESSPPRQLTFGSNRDDNWGISWTPDGRIVWGSRLQGSVTLWMTGSDGDGMIRLTHDRGRINSGPTISPDGQYLIFHSDRVSDTFNLWRLNLTTGELEQLTFGGSETGAVCSPDGKSVIYLDKQPLGLFRIPLLGGQPELISDRRFYATPGISPDGRMLAITVVREGIRSTGVEIVSLDGEMLQDLDVPNLHSPRVLWTPDGTALSYVDREGDGENIWRLPLNGAAATRVTNFETGSIGNFAWAPDGTRIALSRGRTVRDIATLENFR